MNTTNYKNCLFATGALTGNLIASYNFSNQVDSVVLNDLYATGDCYFNNGANNVFYSNKSNLNILQGGIPFESSFTGYFSGSQYAFVKSHLDLTSFNILLDFSFDDCSPISSRVLLSSATGSSLSSGSIFGINQANKFFIEYGTGAAKRIHTSKIGVSENNVINFGIDGQSFYLKKYNFLNQLISSEFFNFTDYSSSDKLFFAKPFGVYSGFSGKFNHVFLSSSNSDGSDNSYYECLFCTGVTSGILTGQEEFSSVSDNLSYYNYSVSGTGITGYQNVTIYDSFTDTYVSNLSGVTGNFLVGRFATGEFLTTTGFFETATYNILSDVSRKSSYIDLIKINFINDLESGDLLEVYDYHDKNLNINLKNNATFNSNIALFSNGMLSISGLDYSVTNGLVSASSDSSDEVRINKINTPIQYLLYSGLYDNYKKPTGGGSEYYPAQSQFYESGDGNVTITGLEGLFSSGFSLTGHDLFMNGQKLYTGIDYETGVYGSKQSVILYAENFNDADLTITTGSSGELISVDYQTESILAFCPVQDQSFYRNRTFLSGSMSSFDLSGKNEEIWLNGIKLIEGLDYGKVYPCSSYLYNFNITSLPYIFCKDNDNFFNIS